MQNFARIGGALALASLLRREAFFCFTIAAVLIGGHLWSCGGKSHRKDAVQAQRHKPSGQHSASTGLPVAVVPVSAIAGDILGSPLTAPGPLRFDSDGNLFVLDRGAHRVIKFSPDNTPLGASGGHGDFVGSLADPVGLAIDNNLNVYVSDRRRDIVVAFTRDLEFVEEIPFSSVDDPFAFGHPLGVAIAADGSLWVGDGEKNRITVFDQQRNFRMQVADYNAGGVFLQSPVAALKDANDDMVIVDLSGQIVRYDFLGSYRGAFGKDLLREPSDAAMCGDGSLWVADGLLREIIYFSAQGEVLWRNSASVIYNGRGLSAPTGVAFDGANRLAISDTPARRILICEIIYSDSSVVPNAPTAR